VEDVEAWELQYLQPFLPEAVDFAWTDEWAYRMFPGFTWIYDKVNISTFGVLKVWDLDRGDMPSRWPVMVRPKLNLLGMSSGTYMAWREEEITVTDGMFAQEPVAGPHFSLDLALRKGDVTDKVLFTGHKDNRGTFWLFSHSATNPFVDSISKSLEPIISKLNGYTGFFNAEFIGPHIIECHLRPSLQFGDLSGLLPRFFGRDDLIPNYYEAYSRVYRRDSSELPRLHDPRQSEIDHRGIMGVSSIQWCYEPEWYDLTQTSQDGFSYRFLVVNGTNYQNVESMGRVLLTNWVK
jgi:hypothetical protein